MSDGAAKVTVYLSLGSNLGDRKQNLRDAIAALPAAGVDVKRVSSIYETEPVDFLDQPWFFNCVVQGETLVPAVPLLRELREIERRMGSKKLIARGPRLIDIDILLYGSQTIEEAEVQIPHPRMLSRKFVLAPLGEIAPDVKHPSWAGTAAELLDRSEDRSTVTKSGVLGS